MGPFAFTQPARKARREMPARLTTIRSGSRATAALADGIARRAGAPHAGEGPGPRAAPSRRRPDAARLAGRGAPW